MTIDTKKLRELHSNAEAVIFTEYVGRPYMQELQPDAASSAFYEAAHLAVPALLDELERLANQLAAADGTIESIRAPHCEGCGAEIDPEVCWCGSECDGRDGHPYVPMGCNCMRDKDAEDWAKIATNLRVLTWQMRKERDDARALAAESQRLADERKAEIDAAWIELNRFDSAHMGSLLERVSSFITEHNKSIAWWDAMHKRAIAERDAAREECGALRAEVERLKSTLVDRAACEHETAEAIATYIEQLMARSPDDWSVTPEDIRDGEWRTF